MENLQQLERPLPDQRPRQGVNTASLADFPVPRQDDGSPFAGSLNQSGVNCKPFPAALQIPNFPIRPNTS